jgi:hypothetical protein
MHSKSNKTQLEIVDFRLAISDFGLLLNLKAVVQRRGEIETGINYLCSFSPRHRAAAFKIRNRQSKI